MRRKWRGHERQTLPSHGLHADQPKCSLSAFPVRAAAGGVHTVLPPCNLLNVLRLCERDSDGSHCRLAGAKNLRVGLTVSESFPAACTVCQLLVRHSKTCVC